MKGCIVMKKRLIALLTTIIMLLNCIIPVCAENSSITAEEFVQQIINEWVASGDELVTWTDETVISNVMPLYGIEDTVEGYIFTLSNNNESAGYIQIRVDETSTFSFVALSFNGNSPVHDLLSKYNFTGDISSDSKLYYCGYLNYYLQDNDGNYYDLTSGNLCPTGINFIIDAYELYNNAK